jgi:protein kinase A
MMDGSPDGSPDGSQKPVLASSCEAVAAAAAEEEEEEEEVVVSASSSPEDKVARQARMRAMLLSAVTEQPSVDSVVEVPEVALEPPHDPSAQGVLQTEEPLSSVMPSMSEPVAQLHVHTVADQPQPEPQPEPQPLPQPGPKSSESDPSCESGVVSSAEPQLAEEPFVGDFAEDPPLCLDDFELLHMLGVEYVKHARHKRSGRYYAIKRLDDAAEAQREHAILAKLNSPLIASCHGMFEAEGHSYLVMEYIGGNSVAWMMKRETLWAHEVIFFHAQMVLCLQYLHERHVVFRALRPANLMRTSLGYLKLINFDCAKQLRHSSDRTSTMKVGHHEYMAPEVIWGRGHGPAADVWSLGICLYRMLTKNAPFVVRTCACICHELRSTSLCLPSRSNRTVRHENSISKRLPDAHRR